MIKVKEYLDKKYYSDGTNTSSLKSDGHYEVHGGWEYPKGITESESIRFQTESKSNPQMINWVPKNQITCSCNNETLQIRMIIIDGKNVTKYGYLQTYKHISRGEPDKNGYYARSTNEEIIRYLDSYFVRIKSKERNWKLKKIIGKYEHKNV